jgi:signal transduction histidine kinase
MCSLLDRTGHALLRMPCTTPEPHLPRVNCADLAATLANVTPARVQALLQHDVAPADLIIQTPAGMPLMLLPLLVYDAHTLLRVAQEALANVACHSKATSVEVRLAWDDAHVRLVVRDDGQGFARAIPVRGLGLRGMRERVEAQHGTLLVTSDATGTTVAATLP